VFLAAVMVLSVVAVSAAFVGSAAATEPYEDAEFGYLNTQSEDVTVVFQGQDVYAVGERIDAAPDETYDLRSVTAFDGGSVDSSSFEQELSADPIEEGHPLFGEQFAGQSIGTDLEYVVEIETDDLDDGDYFLRGGELVTTPVEADTFEITVQSFDATFEEDAVTDLGPDAVTELDIDSDRGTYAVNASADGDLDEDELLEVFVDQHTAGGALVDLHLTESVRSAITFDAADRPQVGGQSLSDSIDDGTLVAAIEAGLDELEDDADADLREAVNEAADDEVISESNEIQDPDAFLAVFGELNPFTAFAFNEAEDDADEMVVLIDIRDTDDDVDFTGIDDGEYTFEFDVADTAASATDTISVAESDADAEFDHSVYTQSAGDLVEFTVELEDTDDAYIQFGDEDAGYIDILYIEDDTDNDEVTVWVNTRAVGAADVDTEDVFYSEDDIVESYNHGDLSFDEGASPSFWDEEVDDGNEITYGEYLEELDLISDEDDPWSDQLVRPLQATTYDLTVDENGNFIADDGESDVEDELGFATLDLTTPGVDSINTWVGPSEDADDETDIAELQERLTERENVAIDDQLVIELETSGIFGHMVYHDDNGWDALEDGFDSATLSNLTDNDGEGVDFTVEAGVATGNQDPNELDLEGASDDEIFVLVDTDAGTMYVIVDTDAEPFDRSIDDGDEFSVSLEYEADDDDRFRFGGDDDEFLGGADGDTSEAAFPYFPTGESESVSTTFTFQDASVEFDDRDADVVQIETGEDVVLTGETNVAPGSDADLRITNVGDTSSFLTTPDATINSDGTFETDEIDFSDREIDDEATLDFRLSGSSIGDASAIFVEAVDDDHDEAVDDEDAAEEDADDEEADDEEADEEVADDHDEAADDDEEPVDDDDSVPGFGLAVAVLALIAAAMVAIRRQN